MTEKAEAEDHHKESGGALTFYGYLEKETRKQTKDNNIENL